MIRTKLEIPLTYMITPGMLTAANYRDDSRSLVDAVMRLARLGLGAVQIREKSIPSDLLYDLALRVRDAISGTDTLSLVNERFDIAAAAGADGVHLTSRSIPVDAVRRKMPEPLLVAVSTHLGADVSRASAEGADFVVFGPVFRTPGKGAPAGLEGLAKAVEAAGTMPVVALGGIDAKNYAAALEAGASGIAAIRLFEDHRAASDVIRKVNFRRTGRGGI